MRISTAFTQVAYAAKRLGCFIKELCPRGFTQADLAYRSHIAVQGLSNSELGKVVPSIPTIASIANALHINPMTIVESGFSKA
ncbi:MAG: XRE family transcriptional regulator [Rhodospirillaceae bacterium]|nr:MAG: XRE family transcriptional regulator [Rhodospirillaceae bacterium]